MKLYPFDVIIIFLNICLIMVFIYISVRRENKRPVLGIFGIITVLSILVVTYYKNIKNTENYSYNRNLDDYEQNRNDKLVSGTVWSSPQYDEAGLGWVL